MMGHETDPTQASAGSGVDFSALSRQLLQHATRSISRVDFFREILGLFLSRSGCDAVEVRVMDGDRYSEGEARRQPPGFFRFRIKGAGSQHPTDFRSLPLPGPGPWVLPDELAVEAAKAARVARTPRGSLWSRDLTPVFSQGQLDPLLAPILEREGGEPCASFVMIPLRPEEGQSGLLILKSRTKGFIHTDLVDALEKVAPMLGAALVGQHTQEALRERLKDLTCLYQIAQLAAREGISLDEFLAQTVNLLPQAYQYPEIASARVVLNQREYATSGYPLEGHRQRANIMVHREERGFVEVAYGEDRLEMDEGPFLQEERNLIDTVATDIGLVIERKWGEEDRARLRDQLRHADRLATIGQLAAGVAHELNEPLGSILGFSQLARKAEGLPDQPARDLERIEKAVLHAREVIRKLMLFSRQIPPRKYLVDLNQVIQEGMYFLESRCAKAGIELVKLLATDIPEVLADPSQLHQVLVNLVVNAIQAMPGGGKLTVETLATSENVVLRVRDTGTGMTEEVQRRLFTPFFTTKEVGQGTGLGLAVVHGIVESHGGSIRVESEVGRGSSFQVFFPIPGHEQPAKGA